MEVFYNKMRGFRSDFDLGMIFHSKMGGLREDFDLERFFTLRLRDLGRILT